MAERLGARFCRMAHGACVMLCARARVLWLRALVATVCRMEHMSIEPGASSNQGARRSGLRARRPCACPCVCIRFLCVPA